MKKEQWMDLFEQVEGFSGVVSVPLDNGDQYHMAKGSCLREAVLPINEATAFGIASGTKGFTALMALKLVDEGMLSLEDKVFDILHQPFPGMDRQVTLRQLLCHTSGIYDYFDEELLDDFSTMFEKVPIQSIAGPGDMYPLLAAGEKSFEPGSQFKYCNGGYVILGMLIEAVSGMTYEDFLQAKIIEPLGLQHTGCYAANRLPANVAVGYEEEAEGIWRSNIFEIPPKCTADGGLYTTVADMDRLWKGLMGGEIIGESLMEEALKVQTVIDGDRCYGLGFYILLNEDGSIKTYSLMGEDPGLSFLSRYYVKEQRTTTIMSNTSFGAWDMNRVIQL